VRTIYINVGEVGGVDFHIDAAQPPRGSRPIPPSHPRPPSPPPLPDPAGGPPVRRGPIPAHEFRTGHRSIHAWTSTQPTLSPRPLPLNRVVFAGITAAGAAAPRPQQALLQAGRDAVVGFLCRTMRDHVLHLTSFRGATAVPPALRPLPPPTPPPPTGGTATHVEQGPGEGGGVHPPTPLWRKLTLPHPIPTLPSIPDTAPALRLMTDKASTHSPLCPPLTPLPVGPPPAP